MSRVRKTIIIVLFVVFCSFFWTWPISYSESARTKRTKVQENTTVVPFDNLLIKCSAFQYIPSDWTLKITRNISDDKSCQKVFKRLMKDNSTSYVSLGRRIKTIVYSNGTEENRGCTKFTPPCKEKAHFDKQYNVRVNSPLCCRKKVLAILDHATRILQRYRINHVLAFGSVLGWVRNRKMIPYDQDSDLIVDGKFWRTKLFGLFLKELTEKHGHTYIMKDNNKKLNVKFSLNNTLSIDIWPFYIKNDKLFECATVHIPHFFWKIQPLSNIFPAQFVKFENIWTYVPRNPVEYTKLLYGKAWEKELTCKRLKNDVCIPEEKLSETKLPIPIVTCLIIIALLIFLITIQSKKVKQHKNSFKVRKCLPQGRMKV